ncbi:MAG: hypothetical protein GEV08_10135 [Acidimicrobiia bacterium]|nr:hypothetical protein [Acidimicrobiia bacterium]
MKRSLVESAWPHGFVHIKLLGNLPAGSDVVEESRVASRYLAKYVGKSLGPTGGLHRYEVAQGFEPVKVRLFGRSPEAALDAACELFGRPYRHVWRSSDEREWSGPPALWAAW